MTRCEYCWRTTDDTRKCVLKSDFSIRAKWSKRKMNICKRCREYLHGFFKYVDKLGERKMTIEEFAKKYLDIELKPYQIAWMKRMHKKKGLIVRLTPPRSPIRK